MVTEDWNILFLNVGYGYMKVDIIFTYYLAHVLLLLQKYDIFNYDA